MLLNKEFLQKHYVDLNKSTRQIAKELGCSREPIRLALKLHGFKLGTAKSKLTGTKIPEERRLRIKKSHLGLHAGEKHPQYKGSSVGYSALHIYIRRRKPQPKSCENCNKITKRLDLANISQQYRRELSDWEYLCRKCHMLKDGRLTRLHRRK
jgi:hypothetical protein